MWTAAFNFLLALLIFAFNVLVLLAIASDHRLRSTTHLLSTNLWLCNCISAVVTIFFSLTPAACRLDSPSVCGDLPDIQQLNFELSYKKQDDTGINNVSTLRLHGASSLELLSAHSAAILLNSTISLLSLLTIGIVHALSRHGYHISRAQSSRLLATTWLLAVVLLVADFVLIRLTRSSLLAVPFHLALLSVFLFLNLIIHPLNLTLLSKCTHPRQEEPERVRLLDECATTSLWLLLNALSFVIIAMMVLWENRGTKESMESLLGLEMAAYSVHCIANPLIAVIRDRRLEASLARILIRSKTVTTEDDLVVALMRDPPPPYS